MENINRNLGHILAKTGVSPQQFANDINARFKTRKDLVRDWIDGRRTPNRSTLTKLAGYWANRFPGIEANWFDADPRQFKELLNVGPEVHASSGRIEPLLPQPLRIETSEGRAVAGAYTIYRRDGTRPELIRKERMIIEFRHNAEPQLTCTYLTPSSLFDSKPESYGGHIVPTEQSYYFIGRRDSSGPQSMTFAILGREPLHDQPVRNGILMGVATKIGAYASALIVEKVPQDAASGAAELVAMLREKDVPSELLARLPQHPLLEPPD